ncbi:hypothetical protein [Mucilaginibacter sp. NFX135]
MIPVVAVFSFAATGSLANRREKPKPLLPYYGSGDYNERGPSAI